MAKIISNTVSGVTDAVGITGGGGGGGGQSWRNVRLPAGFDSAAYLAANPDVARAGMDAAAHYQQYGKNEGRSLKPAPAKSSSSPAPAPAPAVVVAAPPPRYNPKSPVRYVQEKGGTEFGKMIQEVGSIAEAGRRMAGGQRPGQTAATASKMGTTEKKQLLGG